MTPPWTLQDDLDQVLAHTADLWPALAGARLFITGGTGFIGRWLLESLCAAEQRWQLGLHATVLSRDPAAFAAKAPHLAAAPAITLLQGDVTGFTAPPARYTHVIHAATEASAQLNAQQPQAMFDTVVDGTRRVLDLCAERQVGRLLMLSSGAIYGPQPPAVTQVAESWRGGPDCLDPLASYAEAKRAAELLCAIHARQHGTGLSVARIFATLGPFLPLGTHFAAGNFIQDAMAGRGIVIQGDGRPQRSYLYAADLTAWLWRLLVQGPAGRAYNVGCDQAVSVRELADAVDAALGGAGVQVLGRTDSGWNPGRYVPDTSAIRTDLRVAKTVGLAEAIRRTALWHGWRPPAAILP